MHHACNTLDGGQHRFTDRGRANVWEKHERCERPRVRQCVACGYRVLARCRATGKRICSPCAESYRNRVRRAARSGFAVAGRGQAFFLTLTAPGERAHADKVHGGMCPCTPEGGIVVAAWNARLPKRWNRFCQGLKRAHGDRLAYFRGVEVQKRKALHEHIVLMPTDSSQRFVLRLEAIRELAIAHGYGHSVKLERVSDSRGVAGYIAKYVSKACDERPEVPWVVLDTGELRKAAYRPWSSSRGWGLKMSEILAEQRAWAQARELLDLNTESYTRTNAEAFALNHATAPQLQLTGPSGGG